METRRMLSTGGERNVSTELIYGCCICKCSTVACSMLPTSEFGVLAVEEDLIGINICY